MTIEKPKFRHWLLDQDRHWLLDQDRMAAMWSNRSIIGKTVRRSGWRTSIVVAIYDDVPGGVRLRDRIDGFYSWNIAELELVDDEKAQA